jgi:hypothetical protein
MTDKTAGELLKLVHASNEKAFIKYVSKIIDNNFLECKFTYSKGNCGLLVSQALESNNYEGPEKFQKIDSIFFDDDLNDRAGLKLASALEQKAMEIREYYSRYQSQSPQQPDHFPDRSPANS